MAQSVDPLAEHEVKIVEATAEASKLEFENGSALDGRRGAGE